MIDKIKKIREATGLSMAEIKKALDEAQGDEAKALELLQKIGGAMADKKASRTVKEGLVSSYIHSTGKMGVLLEVLCETDFVARNEAFKSLAHDLSLHIAAMKPESADDLLAQPFVKDPNITIKDLLNQSVAKLGENIQIGRFQIFEI